MQLTRLVLEEFRLYQHLELAVPPAGLRIYGANAAGKSSLLEAAFLLSTTRSPRASVERELVRFGSGQQYGLPPYARILGDVRTAQGPRHLELALAAEAAAADGSGEAGLTRKRIKVDGNPRRAHDMVGLLKVVLFTPEDLELVTGGPSGRRRYLDVTLCQLDPIYLRAIARYGRVLLQRNALLKQLQEAGARLTQRQAIEQLAYWNDELVRQGAAVVRRRYDLVRQLDTLARASYARLTERPEELHVGYDSSVDLTALGAHVDRLTPDERETLIARDYVAQLERAYPEELRRGVSVVGPHRDDITVRLGRIPVGAYGSRGQQRLTVLALKLAEVDLMQSMTGEWPVLLLDDLASELDPAHRRLVLETAPADGKQLLITATDRAMLDLPGLAALPWLRAEGGAVVWEE